MRSKQDRIQKGRKSPVNSASRRKFLKQTVAFAALTAGYSVISLTDLACSSSSGPGGGGLDNYYFGNYYIENEYFGSEPFYY